MSTRKNVKITVTESWVNGPHSFMAVVPVTFTIGGKLRSRMLQDMTKGSIRRSRNWMQWVFNRNGRKLRRWG